MKRASEIAHFVFYVAAVLFLGFIAIKIQKIFPGIEALVTHANASVDEIGLTMKAARITAQTEQQSAQQQVDYFTGLSRQTAANMKALGGVIADVDRNQDAFFVRANSAADALTANLGKAGDAFTATAQSVTSSQADLHATALALRPGIESLNGMMDAANKMITAIEPELIATLRNTNTVSANFAAMSADSRKALEKALAPQRLIVTLLEKTFGMTAQGAEIYYYLWKY